MTNIDTIREARNKLCELELNLCNYYDDDVRQLQNNMLEGVAMLDEALAALSTIEADAKHIDPIYDPAIASVRNKQLASLQSDVEEYQETSPGVWQTPSMAHASAAWIDMIQAGEHGPRAQHKMIETLAKHFKSHDDAIRRETVDQCIDHCVAQDLFSSGGGWERKLRASILGTEPAREESK